MKQVMCEDLVFVVLNYNSEDITIKCVDNLLSFALDFHIVVVDNKSPNGSFQKLKEYYLDKPCDVIESKCNGGYSKGNNFGIRYAEKKYNPKYIAIINPDVIIPHHSIVEELISTIEANQNCAVVGSMHVETTSDDHYPVAWSIPAELEFIKSKSIFSVRKHKNESYSKSENPIKVECISGCFFIITMEALRDIGYLDEDIFMYNEETLLGYKLMHKNYYELLRTDLLFYHNHVNSTNPTLRSFMPKRLKRFESDIVLFKKIYGDKIGLILLYVLGYINIVAEYLWFIYKEFKNRIRS